MPAAAAIASPIGLPTLTRTQRWVLGWVLVVGAALSGTVGSKITAVGDLMQTAVAADAGLTHAPTMN